MTQISFFLKIALISGMLFWVERTAQIRRCGGLLKNYKEGGERGKT
jgi:hypothetical protein